jgi:hypothetical protein
LTLLLFALDNYATERVFTASGGRLMNRDGKKKFGVVLLSVLMIGASLPRAAIAGMIDTQTVVNAETRANALSRINRALSQEEVGRKLAEAGVSREAIDARLASLTDTELSSLADRMDSAPAGGDLLAVVGIVFIVLLVLELVGVIDIFKTIGPAR